MTTSSPEPLPPLSPAAASLSAALQARAAKVTVPRATLVEAFHTALPGIASGEQARTALATLLHELADHRLLNLPTNTARWDAGHPALPENIRLPGTNSAIPHGPREPIPWRPELTWAHSARLTAAQTRDLLACNRWFRDTSSAPDRRIPVPLRERSYEIFRDEKRLDALISGALFAPARLTLEQLATYRQPPPLAHHHVGDGDTLLVVENSDTYATLHNLLSKQPGRFRSIAFGAGRSFEASVARITELPGIDRILYYGDLDPDGMAIPARASLTALQHGLPPIEPATGLYRLLLDHTPTPTPAVTDDRAQTLAAWLPPPLSTHALALLTTGQRLAQEATNRNQLSTDPSWRS
jgi:hypothetical protein